MMHSNQFVASLLALSGAAYTLQFNQPRATPVNKRFDAEGWTPKPTTKPKPLMELFRRQEDPAFCGYLEGDPEYPVTCDFGSSCMYDTVYSWFGCCTGTSITDCDVYTACVQSKSIDACLSNSACYNDPFAMVCTDDDEQYCATLYTEISGESYGHFVCAETDTSLEVVFTSSGFGDDSSFFLPTETSEDLFTERPTLTRFSRSSSTTEDEETSTASESSSTLRGNVTPLSSAASRTSAEASSQTAESASTAAAARTAEAMLGAAGGLAGVLAFLL